MDGKSCTVQKSKVSGSVGSGGRDSEAQGSPVVYDLKIEYEKTMKKKQDKK